MIVQIAGNVNYPITLDPTVWIFDDRKVTMEEAFGTVDKENTEEDELQKASMRWDREIYQQKIDPPVNRSISRFEKEKILKETYLIDLKPFIKTSEPANDSIGVTLETTKGNKEVSIEDMRQALALFSVEGRPLKEDGPIHLYWADGSNQNDPITGVTKIIFN
ncbi:hypothetical protein [Thalassobacillus devorans]|uniref:hypothetical protein n=1 Tax=Thalassobacillus devorans TaxID=279813 RepID=UPI000A1CB8D6|nr:hypothetical protein [Thalassobacillus devorans]